MALLFAGGASGAVVWVAMEKRVAPLGLAHTDLTVKQSVMPAASYD